MPSPSTIIGTSSAAYESPAVGRSTKPIAAIAGPMVSGSLAPKRSINPPDQRDSTAMMTVKGRNAAPASVAEKPCTWIIRNGRKKNAPPSPA